jgi:MFS family permease
MTATVELPTGQLPVTSRRRLLNGPFRSFLGAQAASQIADALTTLTLAQVIVFEIGKGATPGTIARTLAVSLLPLALAGPFAGRIADRWQRQRVLTVVGVFKAVATAAAMTVPLTRNTAVGYVAFGTLLVGSRIIYTARSASLPHVVGEDRLVAADSMSAVTGMVAAMLGGLCAAALAGPVPVMALAIAAVLHFTSAGLFGSISVPFGGGDGTSTDAHPVVRDLRIGVHELLSVGRVRRAVITVCIHRFLLAAAVVVLALVADDRYNIEAAGYAVALVAVGIGTFTGTLLTAPFERWFGRERVLAGSFLLAAGFSVVAASSQSAPVMMTAVGGLGFSFQLARVLTDAVVQAGVSDDALGRAFAVYDIAYTLAFVTAGLAVVPLWSVASPAGLLGGIGGVYLVATATIVISRLVGRRTGDRTTLLPTAHV